jgi:hypothetical protein
MYIWPLLSSQRALLIYVNRIVLTHQYWNGIKPLLCFIYIYGTAGEIVYGMAHYYKSTASKEVFGIFIEGTQQFADGECEEITTCYVIQKMQQSSFKRI